MQCLPRPDLGPLTRLLWEQLQVVRGLGALVLQRPCLHLGAYLCSRGRRPASSSAGPVHTPCCKCTRVPPLASSVWPPPWCLGPSEGWGCGHGEDPPSLGQPGCHHPTPVYGCTDLTVRGVWLFQLIRRRLLSLGFAELCRMQGVGQARMVAWASSRSLGP